MTQIPMFSPGSGGLETLLTRRTDPETSRIAARKIARTNRFSVSLAAFKSALMEYGPLTCLEASRTMEDSSYWNAEFNKRVHAWHVAGHIELTGEVRDGGRVWRIKEGA
jgi:hypothetical protein